MVRAIKDHLRDVIDLKNVLQVWGRSFRDEKGKSEFNRATSAQFFIQYIASEVDGFLKHSGREGIYFVPKADNHLPHPDWMVIWVGSYMEAVMALQRSITHAGIVRGKSSWGVRCKASQFAALSKEIRPNLTEHVAPLAVKKLFKLEPVPAGVLTDDLVSWGKDKSWAFRVVKRLGRNAVLVGSAGDPPDGFLSLNGSVVLIKEVQSDRRANVRTHNPLVAGPKMKSIESNSADPWAGASLPASVAPASSGDPWGSYRPLGAKNVAVVGRPKAPQKIDATIAAKFQSIEERMAVFETTMGQLQSNQQSLGESIQQQNEFNKAQFGDVDKRLNEVRTHVGSLQAQIQASMCDALRKQETRLNSRFDQLCEMLQGQTGVVKRPVSQDDAFGDANQHVPSQAY